MNNLLKTENAIYSDIKGLTDSFLSYMNISSEWKSMQSKQHILLSNIDKTIRFSFIYHKEDGWQGTAYSKEESELQGEMIFREERGIQFDFFRKEKNSDSVSTLASNDIAREFRSWVMSDLGRNEFLQKGYFPLRIERIRVGNELSDDYTYTHFAGFDLIVIYEQKKTYQVNSTDNINGKILNTK